MQYVTIQDWMLELGLTSNELITYALIYGFTQDGQHWFHGSWNYIMKWTGASRSTIHRMLKSMIERGYIRVRTSEGAVSEYMAVIPDGLDWDVKNCKSHGDMDPCQNDTPTRVKMKHTRVKMTPPPSQNDTGTRVKMTPNNNINNNLYKNITDIGVSSETQAPSSDEIDEAKDEKKRLDRAETKEMANEIMDYFNRVSGKSYKTTKTVLELVSGRKHDGYTVDDFKKVIDNKHRQWAGNEKMWPYFKPTTLFRPSHFDEYLNEGPAKNPYENFYYRD